MNNLNNRQDRGFQSVDTVLSAVMIAGIAVTSVVMVAVTTMPAWVA
jgi:hypothetical protein